MLLLGLSVPDARAPQDAKNVTVGLQMQFAAELRAADEAHKSMQEALGRQQVTVACDVQLACV